MPAKKSQKKKINKGKGFRTRFKHHKCIYVFIIIIILPMAILTTVNKINDYKDTQIANRDRIQLDQVDAKMKPEFDSIIQKLGKPNEQKYSKRCDYASTKGDPGKPTCGPWYYAKYKLKDDTHVPVILEEIKKAFILFVDIDFGGAYISRYPNKDNTRSHLYKTKDLSHEIRCVIDIKSDYKILDNSAGSMKKGDPYISFKYNCSKSTPYPVYDEVHNR